MITIKFDSPKELQTFLKGKKAVLKTEETESTPPPFDDATYEDIGDTGLKQKKAKKQKTKKVKEKTTKKDERVESSLGLTVGLGVLLLCFGVYAVTPLLIVETFNFYFGSADFSLRVWGSWQGFLLFFFSCLLMMFSPSRVLLAHVSFPLVAYIIVAFVFNLILEPFGLGFPFWCNPQVLIGAVLVGFLPASIITYPVWFICMLFWQ